MVGDPKWLQVQLAGSPHGWRPEGAPGVTRWFPRARCTDGVGRGSVTADGTSDGTPAEGRSC